MFSTVAVTKLVRLDCLRFDVVLLISMIARVGFLAEAFRPSPSTLASSNNLQTSWWPATAARINAVSPLTFLRADTCIPPVLSLDTVDLAVLNLRFRGWSSPFRTARSSANSLGRCLSYCSAAASICLLVGSVFPQILSMAHRVSCGKLSEPRRDHRPTRFDRCADVQDDGGHVSVRDMPHSRGVCLRRFRCGAERVAR